VVVEKLTIMATKESSESDGKNPKNPTWCGSKPHPGWYLDGTRSHSCLMHGYSPEKIGIIGFDPSPSPHGVEKLLTNHPK